MKGKVRSPMRDDDFLPLPFLRSTPFFSNAFVQTHSLSFGHFRRLRTLLHQRVTIPAITGRSLAWPGRHLAVANTHAGSGESRE